MKIWFDIVNTPQVHFFHPIINYLSNEHEIIVTSRNFAETENLLKLYNMDFLSTGKHYGKSRFKKGLGVVNRTLRIHSKIPDFDVAFSPGSISSLISWTKGKKHLVFNDNDQSFVLKEPFIWFVDYLIIPKIISRFDSKVQDKILSYNGFKEEVYIANFIPNEQFYNKIPFDEYVVLRAENLKAIYISRITKTIITDLAQELDKENINIVFLPRFKEEIKLVKKSKNIFVPRNPVNGLDLIWNSFSVLTGAGSLAREAVCMGIPAVSFFPGKQLLAVDKKMIENGWIFHSRDPKEIVEYILNSKKRKVDMSRSKKVQKEVFGIVEKILEEIESKRRKR